MDAVAKRIDNRQGDTIDKETVVNAVSTQVKVKVGTNNLLLCGDSSYEAIKDKLEEYSLIQLPHHGKKNRQIVFLSRKGLSGLHIMYPIIQVTPTEDLKIYQNEVMLSKTRRLEIRFAQGGIQA